MIPRMTCDCNGSIVEYSVANRFVGTGVLLFCFLGYLQMVPVNGDFCFGSGAKVSKNEAEYSKVNCAKKKAAIHERKTLTDRQLFSLKLLYLRCGQNLIIDQLIGLVKGFDHLGSFRMEIDFIQRFEFGRVPDSTFQDIFARKENRKTIVSRRKAIII